VIPTARRTTTAVLAAALVLLGLAAVSGLPGGPATAAARARPTPSAASQATSQATALAGPVTLGQISAPVGQCTPALTAVMYAEAAGLPSYVAPAAGVITSFSNQSGSVTGAIRLVIMGQGSPASHRTVLAYSSAMTTAPNVLNTFPTRVSAPAGSTIAIQIGTAGMYCAATGTAGDIVKAEAFDPTTATDFKGGSPLNGLRLDLSAVLEPDVDGDGYGDVSQDACPQSAATQAPCPAPDTVLGKAPSGRTKNPNRKITFSSTVAGSTFVCTVDGKKAKPCSSPLKRKYKAGTHHIKISAVSPFGIVDPKPAKVRFTVVAT
jgi:hypothetical protein